MTTTGDNIADRRRDKSVEAQILEIRDADVQEFAKWSHDQNGLHVDPKVARESSFGRTIAHGMLVAIRAIRSAPWENSKPLTELDIEFRGAVFPDELYQIDETVASSGLSLNIRQGKSTQLILRASTDAEEPASAEQRNGSMNGSTSPIRKAPADRTPESLAEGLQIQGDYPTDAVPAEYLAGGRLTEVSARVLALCSYLVGMEIPGLRSLFTRLHVRFANLQSDTSELGYRIRVKRFDPRFRILDTDLEVAAKDGRLVAVAELRSYVRFSPAATDLAFLESALNGKSRELAGKVALVCGGSRGLGADITAALALSGCQVYSSFHSNAEAAQDLAQKLAEHNAHVFPLHGDCGDAKWCQATLQKIREQHGRLDILILNACSPPNSLSLATAQDGQFEKYVSDNLRLVRTPLTGFLPALAESHGTVVAISSTVVTEPTPECAHYVTLKHAVEGAVQTASKEFPSVSCALVRPGRLRTSWSDTPTKFLGALPTSHVALQITDRLAGGWKPGTVQIVSEFPEPIVCKPVKQSSTTADFSLVVAATFTAEPIVSGLDAWFSELHLNATTKIAPYAQLVQELLNPHSMLSSNDRGVGLLLLNVSDWLRELPESTTSSHEAIQSYFQSATDELIRAVRAHRAHAKSETLLLICPSKPIDTRCDELIDNVECTLIAQLDNVPGLRVVAARSHHTIYGVHEAAVHDLLRDEIAHVPYKDAYFDVLATIAMRHVHRRYSPLRKVVVLDCDNTLWRGVAGEVGPAGVEFDASHHALHARLRKLTEAGMLLGLCSKNEENDVWNVFQERSDFKLDRSSIVASMLNWEPKSENLRTLATRLNLGLDSFIFIDDNPVECAEVRANCPEVLTLQWPSDPEKALQLLQHTWELDAVRGTAEDQQRTQLYREEFQRQELRDEKLTFQQFIESLELVVDIAPVEDDDLARASQLTLRTNQFNFTTRRRQESDLTPLLASANHLIRIVRVRDRFGDYGHVGLLIAEIGTHQLSVDTFLLSCRVLGRGVEHAMIAELGRYALDRGLETVQIRVLPTPRNEPARKFVDSIVPAACRTIENGTFEATVPAEHLAKVRFEPEGDEPHEEADDSPTPTKTVVAVSAEHVRLRERQIERTAYELSNFGRLSSAAAGGESLPSKNETDVEQVVEVSSVEADVWEVFAKALRLPIDQLKEVDLLERLGCDSFKIVEITVALIEKYTWLPSTLLFEHRRISEIIRSIKELSDQQAGLRPAGSQNIQAAQPEANLRSGSTFGDIAVVGMDVRCAGADSIDELWELLRAGKSSVTLVPPDRKQFLGRLDDSRGHWAGLLDDVERFDAEFFGISPREAESMDPQLRHFLEVAWGALEDAGATGIEHCPDTGVYVGVMYSDYALSANRNVAASESPYKCWEGFSLANRLSQLLGFHGPSLAIDTACSSSGTALHLACKALNANECAAAVVGGINLILDPNRFVQLGRLGILTTTGECRPFGAGANGTVLGEGVGVVVLRRFEEAVRRGDRIYGVIKGSALSTGSGTVGFTAPNPQAQAEAIRNAIKAAKIDPRTISYVETHGTGTELGDPIEVRGLTVAHADKSLWDKNLQGTHRCRLGSIKPSIGHLEAGAGVLGLIKVMLQLKHQLLAPSITSEKPNPLIPFDSLPYNVQRQIEPWASQEFKVNGRTTQMPRRAGLSSFGVGGANAHLILEEAPSILEEGTDVRPVEESSGQILCLSARSEESLSERLQRTKAYLERHPELQIADVCYSANVRRKHFEKRLAIVTEDREQLLQQLDALSGGEQPSGTFAGSVSTDARSNAIAFLFTGQGSQFAGMGRELYRSQPVFRSALDRCAEILEPLLDRPLLEIIFSENDSPEAKLLNQTGYTQPALFSLQYALSELWRSWGILPAVVIGHSVGEITALCVAGCMTLEDGLRIIATRGRLMQALPQGGVMVSVRAGEERVREALKDHDESVNIAAINSSQQVVISGHGDAVAPIVAEFERAGIKTKDLSVSHAFHSPLMDPMLNEFEQLAGTIRFSAPSIPVISCVTGQGITDAPSSTSYWRSQVRGTVRFTDAVAALSKFELAGCLEVGPQPILTGLARTLAADKSWFWSASMRKDASSNASMLESLGQMFVQGAEIDWTKLHRIQRPKIVSLPRYPFNATPYWIECTEVDARTERSGTANERDGGSTRGLLYELTWSAQPRKTNGKHGSSPGRWVIFTNQLDATKPIVESLIARKIPNSMITLGDRFEHRSDSDYHIHRSNPKDFATALKELASKGDIERILAVWSSDVVPPSSAHDVQATTDQYLEDALHLVQAAATSFDKSKASPKIWFVTKGAVATPGAGPTAVNVLQSPLWGFGRVAGLEFPELWGGLIDLPADGNSAQYVDSLIEEIAASGSEDQVALRDGTRLVPRLRPSNATKAKSLTIHSEGVYLVTGGLGALGVQVAQWLASKGARHLILTSRSGRISEKAQTVLEALTTQGVRVETIAADIADPTQVKALEPLLGGESNLRGVVHAAGLDKTTALRAMSVDELQSITRPKVVGSWLLNELVGGRKLDFFVCFSSISSVWGSSGRAHYAAANAFLDALVHQRRSRGLPGLAINWGPWAGGGMATDEALRDLEKIGNRGLEPNQALAAIEQMLECDLAQAVVADVNWPKFRQIFEARRARPIFSELEGSKKTSSTPESKLPEWVQRLSAVEEDKRGETLSELLRAELAGVLGFKSPAQLDPSKDFFQMGMDSLMAVDLSSRLRKRLGIGDSTLVMDHPRLEALTAKLLEKFSPVVPLMDEAAAGTDRAETFEANKLEEKIFEFHRVAWPHRRTDWILPRWRWMFVESARRLDLDPKLWLEWDQNQLVGHMGAIPVRLKVGPHERTTAWLVETMVLESHRTKAVGSKLLLEANHDMPFSLSLGQTAQIREMQFHLGWRQIAPLKTLVLPLRPRRVLAGKLNPVMKEIAGAGITAVAGVKRMRASKLQVEPVEIERFGVEHDQLWNSVKDSYRCAIVRDASYLNWKYVTQPGQDFIRLEIRHRGTAVAVAVLSVTEPDSVYTYRRAHLVDLVAPAKNHDLLHGLFEAVRQACRARNVDSIVFHIINAEIEAAARSYGFLNREPTRYLLIRSADQSSEINGHLDSARDWLITTGDSDIDRPW